MAPHSTQPFSATLHLLVRLLAYALLIVASSQCTNAAASDAQEWKELSIKGVGGRVKCVAFSPDGQLLALGQFADTRDKPATVVIMDMKSGAIKAELKQHKYTVSRVCFLDNSRVVSTDDRGFMRVWDIAKKTTVASNREHTNDIRSLATSADRKSLISAGHDGAICLWTDDFETPNKRFTVERSVPAADISPDGKYIAAAGDETVYLLRAADGDVISKTACETPTSVAMTAKSDGLFIANADGEVSIFDVPDLKRVSRFNTSRHITQLRCVPDSKDCVIASIIGHVQIYNKDTGEIKADLVPATNRTKNSYVSCIEFSPDGNTMVACLATSLKAWTRPSKSD